MRMSELEGVLLSELLQLYSLQRHDFMNHWQVIMGNLQLNKPDKALLYIKDIIGKYDQEQKVARLPDKQFAAVMLGLVVGLNQLEVEVTLDYPEVMKKETFWQENRREEYVEALYGYTREWLAMAKQTQELQNPLNAEIYLYDEPEGFSCQFILADEEDEIFNKLVKFRQE